MSLSHVGQLVTAVLNVFAVAFASCVGDHRAIGYVAALRKAESTSCFALAVQHCRSGVPWAIGDVFSDDYPVFSDCAQFGLIWDITFGNTLL